MIIEREILNDRAKKNDIKWLNLSSTQNRLKLFIKNNENKLDPDTIKFIWASYNYRPQLVKFQKLPPEIIAEALQHRGVKDYMSTATYINLITFQSLTDEQLLSASDISDKYREDVWKAVSPKIYQVRNCDIEYIISLIQQTKSGFYEDIIYGIVKLLEDRKLSIIDLLKRLFGSGKYFECFIDNLLLVVSKKFLIADNVVDEIISLIEKNTQDSLLIVHFSEYLIARNNCSINMKAKLLLKNI